MDSQSFDFQESNKYLPIYHSILSFKAYQSKRVEYVLCKFKKSLTQ